MEKVASLAILLVCFVASNAHAGARWRNVGGRNAFRLHGVNGTGESSIKSPDSTNDSVVESWSLVCEDLCRVGFGGPRCGSSCIAGSKRHTDESRFSDFCPVMCDFALGGHNCACPLASKRLNGKVICSVLCRKFKLKVRGCSECRNAERSIDNIDVVLGIAGNQTTDQSEPTETTIFLTTNTVSSEAEETSTASLIVETPSEFSSSILQESSTTANTLASASTESTTQSIELTSGPTLDVNGKTTQYISAATDSTNKNTSGSTRWTIGSTHAITESTESSTPTEPSTTATNPTALTTPNWSEMCKGLCKIGEGGSLCNCDLPPLMSAY